MADEVLGVGARFTGSAMGEILTVRDIDGPEGEADDIDVTSNIDATGQFVRRFRPGFVDEGEVKVTAVFTAAGYAAAVTNRRVQQSFTITLENGSILALGEESYIKAVTTSFPYEEEATMEITVKASGSNTFTP